MATDVDDVLAEVIEAEEADTGEDSPPGVEEQDLAADLEDVADPAPPPGSDLEPQEIGEELAEDAPVEEEIEAEADAAFIMISAISGVPLYYERGPGGPARYRFPVARSFVPVLKSTVREVRQRTPPAFGKLERISSGGIKVAKEGMHGAGRAVDWDRWVFENLQIAPLAGDHAAGDRRKRQRYWGLAAICRSISCYTLHGEYDAAHRDHIHHDNMVNVGFSTARSTVQLTQALCNNMFGANLGIDGQYGPRTRAAVANAVDKLGLQGDISSVAVWRAFLRRSARLGFVLSVR